MLTTSRPPFTGLVRGSIRSAELHHVGPWVRMTELLSAFNEHTKERWGVHEVLALIFQNNKQRSWWLALKMILGRSTTSNRCTPSGSGRPTVIASTLTSTTGTSLCLGLPWCQGIRDL